MKHLFTCHRDQTLTCKVAQLAGAGLLLLVTARGAEITDAFSSALDPQWDMYAPLAPFGVPVTFASQDGVLTLSHPPSPVPQIAPAVVGVSRSDANWSDFQVSADFSGWSAGAKTNTSIVIGGRTSAGKDGLPNQYLLAIQPSRTPELEGTSYVSWPGFSFEQVVNGQSVATLAGTAIPELDPSKWYRVIFRGKTFPNISELGLAANLYEVGVAEPIARLSMFVPAVYYSGTISLGAVDRSALAGIANNGVTVKFDNFTASGTPVTPVENPSVTINRAVMLSWPAATVGWSLESAPEMGGPWTPVAGTPVMVVGDENRATVNAADATRHFRLRKP